MRESWKGGRVSERQRGKERDIVKGMESERGRARGREWSGNEKKVSMREE